MALVVKDSSLVNDETSYRPYIPKGASATAFELDTRHTDGDVAIITTTDKTGFGLVKKTVNFKTSAVSTTAWTDESTVAAQRQSKYNKIHAVQHLNNDVVNSNAVAFADSLGNVFVDTLKQDDEQLEKRKRREECQQGSGTSQTLQHVLSVHDHEAMQGDFDVPGASGLCQLTVLQNDANRIAFCAREFFKDIRVFSFNAPNQVMRSIYPMHAPTAVSVLNANVFAVAEGPVVSLWDLREATPCVNRLTTTDMVADVSLTDTNEVYVGSTNRSVVLYDTRKWSKVKSLQGVTKHPIGGIIPFPTQNSVLVTGTDTEAKVVGFDKKPATAGTTNDCEGGVHSFRQRYESSINADYAWHGKWVADSQKTTAIGCSATGELFLVRTE